MEDSIFQVGSIAKVQTATVAIQRVGEGLLDLDSPIAEVLPELELADTSVAELVTMRHLLSHTSGIDGVFSPIQVAMMTGVEKYIAPREVEQSRPLGATFSYCNSGFVTAVNRTGVSRDFDVPRVSWSRYI